VGLLPDGFTAQCPWCADTYKPVLLSMVKEKSEVDKQYSDENGEREVRADLVPEAPEYDLDLNGKQEEGKQENESIIIIPEFLVVLFVRIDAGKDRQQCDKTGHDEGDEKQPPELRHVAVNLAGSVPVRGDVIRSSRVDGEGQGECDDEYSDDSDPDEFHISLLGINPAIR